MSKHKNNNKTYEQAVDLATTYATFVIVYANDCAANLVKSIEKPLSTMPYRGTGAKRIYGALKKRAATYFEAANTILRQDLESIAEFSCVMDDVVDPAVEKFRKSVQDLYERNGVAHGDFYAAVETCRVACEMACIMNDDMVKKLKEYADYITNLRVWRITELFNVAQSLADFVYTVIPEKVTINLNDDEAVKTAFVEWNNAMGEYKNFKHAFNRMNKEMNNK